MAVKKVAMIGFTESVKLAPWTDPSWEAGKGGEFWGLNFPERIERAQHRGRAYDRWFEMHLTSAWTNEAELMRRGDLPTYLIEKHPDIPKSITFPKDQVLEHFKRPYFTNSFSWMLGLAIIEGFEEIHLYGVDMAIVTEDGSPSELEEQRPSIEWLLGWAMGLGIKVVLPTTSDLLKAFCLYGYEEELRDDFRAKARARIIELKRQAQYYRESASYMDGAIKNMLYLARSWDLSSDEPRSQEDREVLEMYEPTKR